MKNHIVYLILLSHVMACQNQAKVTDVPFVKDNDVLTEVSFTPKQINCDSVWEVWSYRQSRKDSIIRQIVNEFENTLPEENYELLLDLIVRKDSLLKFKQPLSAVFNNLAPEPFIISNAQWKKLGEGYIEYFPESYLLEEIDALNPVPSDYQSRKYFKNILNEFPKEDRQIKVIGLKDTQNALVSVLGIYHSDCEPYVFYNFEYLTGDSLSTPLLSSKYQIEIEYGNWPNIDSLIEQDPIHQCTDCLNSYDKAKTFARLKGTTNVFFSFQGSEQDTEDSYTPGRSLFQVNQEGEITTLWTDSIDLFGCACL